MTPQKIARLIDESPTNRGVVGAQWVADPDNIAVNIDGNVMLFECGDDGLAKFHWLAMARKGRPAINDTREAIRQVFHKKPEIQAIFGLVSRGRPDSAIMARWVGFKPQGSVVTAHGLCQIFVMTRDTFKEVSE